MLFLGRRQKRPTVRSEDPSSGAASPRFTSKGRRSMSYRFEAGRIYRMPTHFGPAPGPRQVPGDVVVDPKRSPRRLSVAASFLTDPVVLEQHLPEGFTLSGEPVVTVEFHHMTDIDWLAGRGQPRDGQMKCGNQPAH